MKKEDEVVGHIPFNIAALLSNSLRRECKKCFADVTGTAVNRGAGYGMEIPLVYRLYGPPEYIARIRLLIESLIDKGIL